MDFHSKMVRGTVCHRRLSPTEHRFAYPYTFFIFDLDELSRLDQTSALFGYNHFSALTIHDRDFLHQAELPITEKLDTYLPRATEHERTLLVSSPNYFGYAFNPVNFHLRIDGSNLTAAVVEVNNTFGDRHIYPLNTLLEGAKPQTWHARCPKDFHVSPFNDLHGDYHFTFRISEDSIFLGVDLYKSGARVMETYMEGRMKPLTSANMIQHALLHPFDTALNSLPRITWQAAQLYYKRKLAVYTRPSPHSKMTVVDRDHPECNRPVI